MKKIFIACSMLVAFFLCTPHVHAAYEVQFDEASKTRAAQVFELLEQHAGKSDVEKLDLISAYFKETPYVANRLVGNATTDEQLVIALNELDCFTYVDYIEAFKRSKNVDEFVQQLVTVRYINGVITYLNRKHFFSDWVTEPTVIAEDVLKGDEYASIVQSETVDINKGAKGEYIAGLPDRMRTIVYIPRDQLTPEVLKTLKTGDYVGLRTSIAGLDVTHCGIIIQKEDGTYMRHASSAKSNYKVVDQKLSDYFEAYKRPTGIVVFRSNTTFAVQPVTELVSNGVIVRGASLANTMSLTVTPLAQNSVAALEKTEYDAYDITLTGAATSQTGDFEVTVPTKENQVVEKVYYVSEAGELTELSFSQVGNAVVFDTMHFSTYAVAYAKKEAPKQEENNTNKETTVTGTVEQKEEKKQEEKADVPEKTAAPTLPNTGSASHYLGAFVTGVVAIALLVAYKRRV